MYRDADPSRHITRNAPPFLVLIAEAEQFQPPILEQSKRFALQMQAVNVSVTVEVLKDRKHMSAMREMADPNDPTLSRIQNFVRDH
jgi:acetyl esterase/lipase